MTVDLFETFEPTRSRWHEISQELINGFADLTQDWQYIHVDPERAAQSPFGGTVAHGFLTLSMLATMATDVTPKVPGAVMGVNYGFDKVRFIAPVPSGSRIRALFEMASVRQQKDRLVVRWQVTVEIEGSDKPALIADWLNVFLMEK